MAGRTLRPTQPHAILGSELRRVLRGIAAGTVIRDDCGGQRRGMWALHVLDADDVSMTVRILRRSLLVDMPLVGPPRITADGRAALRRTFD